MVKSHRQRLHVHSTVMCVNVGMRQIIHKLGLCHNYDINIFGMSIDILEYLWYEVRTNNTIHVLSTKHFMLL